MVNKAPDSYSRTLAQHILDGFQGYRDRFKTISHGAQQRFEQADWLAATEATRDRLLLYKGHMHPVADLVAASQPTPETWRAVKQAYHELSRDTADAELAETFYNSVYREVTNDQAVVEDEMFVASSLTDEHLLAHVNVRRVFHPHQGIVYMLRQILTSFQFNLPWADIDRDISNVLRSLAEARPEIRRAMGLRVEILRSAFFRNKGAYLIGKICYEDQSWPVALPVLNDNGKLYIDTLICDEDEMSVMFSFTRAYFMVDTEHPRALVEFLHEILPNKTHAELYASVGLYKHGKTEFYRGFLAHLADSDDPFIIAPGIKGMVMAVFLLPSYRTVFKVIKDRFAPQKNITADQVKEKYAIVKSHDRVGRMADTQEFHNFSFPLDRFSPELIADLQETCANSIEITGDRIIIKHLYTEREMTPLNIFVDRANDQQLQSALDEYGNAIKQLAAANIFPGDMLLKNFGITRHGRVVFYDYDEISYLTDMNFRHIPEPQTPEQEMSAEVWYSVAENDVFPEEFRRFLFGKRNIKARFTEMHGELFDAEFWQDIQQNVTHGQVSDVFPYRRKKRFARSYGRS